MTFALGVLAGWLIADHLRIRREFVRLERFLIGSNLRSWASFRRPDVAVRDYDWSAHVRGE